MMAIEDNIEDKVIYVRGITKAFGNRLVLKGIDFYLNRGDFLIIFGPNGAGKTTLLRILSTLSRATKGILCIEGIESRKYRTRVRKLIGFVSHENMLYNDLTAYENLKFFGSMYDVPDLQKRIHALIYEVGLKANMHQRVGTFSHGMRKKLSIARALIHDPLILLLDEPESGLDHQGKQMLIETLGALSTENRTIIMTSHNIEISITSASHIAILNKSKLVFFDTIREMNQSDIIEIYREYTEPVR